MKKFLATSLAILIVLSMFQAFAETDPMTGANIVNGSFSVRSGITFGMTEDEVKGVEKDKNGLEVGREYENDLYNELAFYPDSLAGITWTDGYKENKLSVYYLFDKESDQLEEIEYNFGALRTTYDYDELKTAITEKYGRPLHDNDGMTFSVTTDRLRSTIDYLNGEVPKQLGYTYSYCEWLLQFDEYYVIIDLIMTDKVRTPIMPRYVSMAYSIISNEQMDEIVVNALLEDAKQKSDL